MYSLVLMMALSSSADVPAAHGGCHGCSGCHGCYASSCHGGSGCHGCHGGMFKKKHGCHGCHGCSGGYACNGCNGGYGCTGAAYGCTGAAGYGCTGGAPVVPPPPPPKKDGEEPKKKKGGDDAPEAGAAAPATIVVSLPAEAKLSIDDRMTVSTSAVRTFATPALEAGKEYYYTLKAEVVRDGKTVTSTERVAVRAGQTSRITLDVPATTGVASAK